MQTFSLYNVVNTGRYIAINAMCNIFDLLSFCNKKQKYSTKYKTLAQNIVEKTLVDWLLCTASQLG